MSNDNKIYIFDTTLRDGEQAPGFSMGINEKLLVARQLKKLNVDIIEVGFPVSSPTQFEAAEVIAKEVEGLVIAGLARAVEKDITTCYNAIKHSKTPRIHTFIATSHIHMEYKLKKQPDVVLKMAVEGVKLAKLMCDDVEFSAEDATRSDLNFLAEITDAVIEAGARTINIPDTVGYTTPAEYYQFLTDLFSKLKNADKAIFSVHCHNDLGLAVANSLSAIEAGVRQIECTVNGIGERAGNASLEEIVMILNTRKDKYNKQIDINTEEIYQTSNLLSKVTGVFVQPNKAIVGKNAFAHESGIHQDGFLKHRSTYEIMTPESVGMPTSSIVLGRHSGKHGFKKKLQELNVYLEGNDLENAYQKFLNIADKKKEVYDEDLLALVDEEIRHVRGEYELKFLLVTSGSDPIVDTATVVLDKRGNDIKESCIGDGPVDAVFSAIKKITGLHLSLESYHIKAVTPGTDAFGEVHVTLSKNEKTYSGHGASTDIIIASAKAYISAINRYLSASNK